MRLTRDHRDRGYIEVRVDGCSFAGVLVMEVDTVARYVVVEHEGPRVISGCFGGPPRPDPPKVRRAIFLRPGQTLEVIDTRTGRPYDELYQAAERAAMEVCE